MQQEMIYEEEYSDDIYIDDDDDLEDSDEKFLGLTNKNKEEFVDDFIEQENKDYNRQDMGEFDKMDNGYIDGEKSETL